MSEVREMAERIASVANEALAVDEICANYDAAYLASYAEVAEALGYVTPDLELQQFRTLCAERGIVRYDRARVKTYLDQKYGGESKDRGERGLDPQMAWQIRQLAASSKMQIRQLAASSKMPFEAALKQFGVETKRATWGWRPLVGKAKRTEGWSAPSKSDQIITSGIAYTKPVPMPVLLTAKAIKDVAPNAKFYVSDEIHEADMPRTLDPFLAVAVGGEFFIVERWDEPGFKA